MDAPDAKERGEEPGPGRVLIVVPTYAERENVAALARDVHAVLPAADLLFVDDASPDGTGEAADALAAGDPRIRVLHRPRKLGLGTAYVAGFRYGLACGYDRLVEMDADGSHDPACLPHLLERARAGVDLVIGSRLVPGAESPNRSPGRRLITVCGSLYARAWLGLPVRDITAGFLCWSRRALESIDLGTIRSRGFFFQVEMKFRAFRAGLRLEEVPIRFLERRSGRSKLSLGILLEAVERVGQLRSAAARREAHHAVGSPAAAQPGAAGTGGESRR